jgi:hypothetical protein
LKHEELPLGDVDPSQSSKAEGMIPESGQLFRRNSKGIENQDLTFDAWIVAWRRGDIVVVVADVSVGDCFVMN